MNVAAYCRVSTDDEDQANSLENQVQFFSEYINRHEDWTLVDVFTDNGVSGTSLKHRVKFNRMIEIAYEGKIDLIVTKEVSRFARNTVDTLNYTRKLRMINVGVLFINDNINTLDDDGEFRLSIMASVAQEESRKTSARVKWGMKRQMEKGFVFSPPLIGYDCSNGVLTINEEEAEVVRKIFDLYVNHNIGTMRIAKKLAEDNTPLCKRIRCWSPTLVMRIINNEKYVGDLIQQKTIVKDYLSHVSVLNDNDKQIFRNHHESIVDRATWNRAQEIRAMRTSDVVEYNPAKHTNKYWCSGKIQCGVCSGTCVTKTKKALYGLIRVYRCKHTTYYENGRGSCTNKSYIDERILTSCMQYVIQNLPVKLDRVVSELIDILNKTYKYSENNTDLKKYLAKKESLDTKKKRLLSLLLDNTITKDEFHMMNTDIENSISETTEEINRIKQSDKVLEINKQTDRIKNLVTKYFEQSEPTTHIYDKILNKIVVFPDQRVDVYLNGIDIPFSIKYRRSGRGTQYVVVCEEYKHNISG